MEAFRLEHVPDNICIFMTLFRDVQNAAFLQGELVARNSAFEYAFLDAGIVGTHSHDHVRYSPVMFFSCTLPLSHRFTGEVNER
jgi:hypothetical protein